MTSPPFESLLSLQDLDSAVDRLRHRHQTLPERTELAAVDERAAGLAERLSAARARLASVADRQAVLESDLAQTEARAGEVNKRLYSGQVTASRELQAMAADVDSLRARASSLEEQVLEVLLEREPLDDEVSSLEEEVATLDSERGGILARLGVAEADLDEQVRTLEVERGALAGQVPDELLATYERLRAKLGGVGAARLTGGSCSGCHLALPATEIDRLKHTPPDDVVFCEQCGRILVR